MRLLYGAPLSRRQPLITARAARYQVPKQNNAINSAHKKQPVQNKKLQVSTAFISIISLHFSPVNVAAYKTPPAFLIVSANHRHKTAANLKQNDAFISLATLCGKIGGREGVVFVLVTVHKTGVLGMKIFLSLGATTPIGGCILQPSSGL